MAGHVGKKIKKFGLVLAFVVICGYSIGMETNPTTQKPIRLITKDYVYRGRLVLRGEVHNSFIVGRRSNNGNYAYSRFKTLKAACAYIDKNYDLFTNEV